MSNDNESEIKIAIRILRWFCPDHLFEELSGDLMQRYERDVTRVGREVAGQRLFWNTLKFFRPSIILRGRSSITIKGGIMWRNYFTVMVRNLTRHKFYSAINVTGLVVGLTFAMLIGSFIWSELQVNKTLKDVDRLYLLENKYKTDAGNFPFFSPAPLGPESVHLYPAIFEGYYRFWDRNVTISKDDKHFRIQTMIGDSTFLEMFGFQVLHGDPETALSHPFSIVLSEKTARQYFDRSDVVGETMTVHSELGGLKEFVVTAVVADPEEKNSVSDFMSSDAQVFLPLQNSNLFNADDANLWSVNMITYMKLRAGASPIDAAIAMNKLIHDNLPADISLNHTVELDPLEDYYLMTNHGAVMTLLVSLGVIVCFVLILAIVNFINITISSSFSRLKEIGVRKAIGGVKAQVFFQFISESVVLAFSAGVASLVFYELLRGYFGEVLRTHLPSILNADVAFFMSMVGIVMAVGFLAGIYPSTYLSSTGTIESLKGKFKSVKGTIQFSRGLIAAQFLIAIFVFVAALIMSRQVSFFLKKDLGYDQSFIVNVTSAPRLWTPEGFDKIEASKTEFLSLPEVKAVTISWGAPSGSLSPTTMKVYRSDQTADEGILASVASADEDYAEVYGMTVSSGEFLFQKGASYKPRSLVLNESARSKLKVSVGDKVRILAFGNVEFTVVGVVKDFNFETLHKAIEPVLFVHNRDFTAFRHFSFKMAPGSLNAAVAAIESKWKQVFPNDAFLYNFVDQQLQGRYKTELQLKQAFKIAAVLILIIMLTGVLGLVSLSVSKKTKEIGIRKVLGASVANILVLLSREYVWAMLGAFTIGLPLTFLFINRWLGGFAYHIDLAPWMFSIPAIFLFVITILVVSAQAFKVASSNPVEAIKHE